MPIFDFRCPKCGFEKETMCKADDVQRCTECGDVMRKVISAPHVYHPFREGWFEHIDKDPIYITSKKQLRRECDKRGVSSHYLD